MTITLARLLGWLALYLGLALLPMMLAVTIDRPAPRGYVVELGAMLGLLGLGVLGMQLVITGRHRWFGRAVGQDNMLQFHRQTGLFAWMLVLAHPLTMFIGNPAFLGYLDPRDEWLRAASLSFVLVATTFLVASSVWRLALDLSYERWRLIHGGLSFLVVATGLGHALMVGNYTADWVTRIALALLVGLALLLTVESRVLRPHRLKRFPWKVVEVEPEPGDATRWVVEAQGHPGMPFKPGQYAWITLGDTPFSMQQHPFSMSSDATRCQRLEFTAKHSGDFTRGLATLEPGTLAWIEGPYGIFSMDPARQRRTVFIAGGIGITPVISMLRSSRALSCNQPMWLIYANEDVESIVFREEIQSLARDLPLQVVHVLNESPENWSGETGFVDRELLERHLPEDDGNIDYFLCGPTPMLDEVEPALRARGAPLTRLYSERFDLV